MGCAAFKAGDLSVGDVKPGETELTEEWGKSVAGNFDSVRYGVAYFPCHSDQDRYRTPFPSTVRMFLAQTIAQLGILAHLLARAPPATLAPAHPPPAVCHIGPDRPLIAARRPCHHQSLREGPDRGDQNKGVQGEDDNDEKFFAFGLFDGHGKSAVVADLCQESLLDEVVRGDATDAAAVGEEAEGKGASADEEIMIADQIKARVVSTQQIQIDDKERIQQGRALSEGPASPLPSDKAIVNAFQTVHQRVAHQYPGTRGGATATTLFLGANSTDAKTWDLKCGWAGDSGCMVSKGKLAEPARGRRRLPPPRKLGHHRSPSETIHHSRNPPPTTVHHPPPTTHGPPPTTHHPPPTTHHPPTRTRRASRGSWA